MKLSAKNLNALKIPIPKYERSRISIGIVHFGVDGFHRAHQAMYLDELLNAGLARDWGICGVGALPGDQRMRDALRSQDYTQPRVIGSIIDFRYAPDDSEAVMEFLADPATRIISLTVTEGGYNIRHDNGKFDVDNPAILEPYLWTLDSLLKGNES